MSAQGIADAVVKAIDDKTFDVMVVNFANADMVGHSGKIPPTITAVETVDALPRPDLHGAASQRGGAMIVTADHGNAEQMIDPAAAAADGAHHQSGALHRCAGDAVTPANFKGDSRRLP